MKLALISNDVRNPLLAAPATGRRVKSTCVNGQR